jgi:hypothetical protein
MNSQGQIRVAAWAVLTALVPLSAARGDTFHLTSGGQVQGEWLNKEEAPLVRYVIRQASGVKLTLTQEQVREHLRESPAEREYEALAEQTPDTVEAQWKLADWCRDHHLGRQRTTHLTRIIELDPNHQKARALLGFTFLGGRWTTKQDYHRAEGFELFKGRWRTTQEIELLETRSQKESAEKAWLAKLVRLRPHLASDQGAVETVAEIKDPAAIPALGTMLARERMRQVKMLYLDVLEGIESGEVLPVLVRTALSDPDEEVYHYCLDVIVRKKFPHVADPFITALKDSSNAVVNRAAMALARIGDSSAVSPLIDSLVTVHQRTLPGRIPAGATASTFSSDGSTSVVQNEGPRVIISQVQNQEVLSALTKLTGTTFGYDQRAWRLWYHQERRAQAEKIQKLDANQ